jgi:hypothetical protein
MKQIIFIFSIVLIFSGCALFKKEAELVVQETPIQKESVKVDTDKKETDSIVLKEDEKSVLKVVPIKEECATDEIHKKQMETDSVYRKKQEDFEKLMLEIKKKK